MEHNDIYRTIESASGEVLYKEKNSKFFGYAFPVVIEDEVKIHLEALRKKHHSAVHFCYAWQMGTEKIAFRANDDGEPGNSAGMPILGQIQSFKLTNVLVVVVRYFGGVKLGVGGLMSAYKTAAQMALEDSDITERTIDKKFLILFDYKYLSRVMRIVREMNAQILSQKMEMDCEILISVRLRDSEKLKQGFASLYEIELKEY